MIFVLQLFPYHDGRLLYDEILQHDDLWMNDLPLSSSRSHVA
jgi:hypothetical protein